jgi:hypothetical protein
VGLTAGNRLPITLPVSREFGGCEGMVMNRNGLDEIVVHTLIVLLIVYLYGIQ